MKVPLKWTATAYRHRLAALGLVGLVLPLLTRQLVVLVLAAPMLVLLAIGMRTRDLPEALPTGGWTVPRDRGVEGEEFEV